MKEVQNEECELHDAINIILEYNKEIDEKLSEEMKKKLEIVKADMKQDLSDWTEKERYYLKFKLNMLQNLMISPNHNNINRFIDDSMDFPTNDYFVYSSHNTYLKGHQLYGESSVEMYAYAISMGCRCVELDCWDGPDGEPKITHGMTFTSDITLKDVLYNIKENAFKKTDSPFFLSIEMHCSDEQQKRMAEYFRTILKDTWIPEHDSIPNSFPTPKALKRKFIIKCKRPKVYRTNTQEKEKKYYDEDNNKKTNGFDMKRNLSVIKETDENMMSNRATINNDTARKQSKHISMTSMKKLEDIDAGKAESPLHKEEPTIQEKEKIAKDTLKNKKKTIKEVTPNLYDLIGLISVPLKIDDILGARYQPWDVVSLSESKVLKHYKDEKKKLIEFSSNSFLRVYPSGARFDSSNFDPVKGWICGGQLVSLNLQSLHEDYTLLNHLFFKISNGSGYILKPNYLRSGTFHNKDYFSPAFSLKVDILSGIMLQKCMKEHTTELYVTVNVIGTFDDDKNEPLKTDPVKENFLHPKFKNSSKKFSIYEDNLSFLLIKIFDNNGDVLARSVVPMMSLMEGYRNIFLYDSECQEIENSILILRTKRLK